MVLAKRLWPTLVVALACGLLTACESTLRTTDVATTLPAPDAAYDIQVEEYRISPNDKLSIVVYADNNFNLAGARVDAGGNVLFPKIGLIPVKGLTAAELASDLDKRLKDCCLRNPQVVVQVDETSSQQIMVTGAVTASDIYNLRGRTTLLQAITMAKGPDRGTANLKRVGVIRTIDGKKMLAVYDVAAIRNGEAEDPQIYGGDQIIVDTSKLKSAWRGAVSALPFLGYMF